MLVVGGLTLGPSNFGTAEASTLEWYDPETATIQVVDGVTLPRRDMSVTALQDGGVIAVAGGADDAGVKGDVRLFSFSGGKFVEVTQSVPALIEPRRSAAVVTLNGSNDMLLLGGYSHPTQTVPLVSSELFRSSTRAVTQGPNISGDGRGDACTAVLPDNSILMIGGRTIDASAGTPSSDSAVNLIVPNATGASVLERPGLQAARYHHTCTVLLDGTVLMTGGVREVNGVYEVLQDALIYTPAPIDP